MAQNISKKFAGLLALSCAFVLGACDPIVALPTTYQNPILTDDNGNAVPTNDNIMGKVYDSVSSNQNEKVLQRILDDIANKKYGTYSEIKKAYDAYIAHEEDSGNPLTDVENYIKAHKDVFDNVEPGTVSEVELERFGHFSKDIMARINEAFFNLIKNTDYQDAVSKMFDEEKLYNDLAEDLWDLHENTHEDNAPDVKWNKFYITSAIDKEKTLDYLHSELYSYDESEEISVEISDGRTVKHFARGYIEKKIFPEIIKDMLVEEYIYTNQPRSLGRAYARNVVYTKVAYTSENEKYVSYIVDKFVTEKTKVAPATDEEGLDFEAVHKAMLGFDGINKDVLTDNVLVKTTSGMPYNGEYAEEAKALNAAYFTSLNGNDEQKDKIVVEIPEALDATTIWAEKNGLSIFPRNSTTTVYADTELGKLLDSYIKANRAKGNPLAHDDDKKALGEFDEDNLFESLRDKIIGLVEPADTIIQDGWYVSNGGLSDMPMRENAFSYTLANNFDSFFKESEGTYGNYIYKNGNPSDGLLKTLPVARNIEGRIFVMPTNADGYDINANNFVLKESGAFHICQVLQATDPDRLAEKSKGGSFEEIEREQYSREIAKVLSTKDNYITNAYTNYLEAYEFEFSDTSLYEYLKSQYPDLSIFEDEE